MFDSLQVHGLGVPIPDTPHAVSCSLPTMQAVVAYEEKDPATLKSLQAGYPRFVRHRLIARFLGEIEQRQGLQGRALFALRSDAPLEWIRDFVLFREDAPNRTFSIEGFWEDGCFILHAEPSIEGTIQTFLQHTGASISSRQAEDALQKRSLLAAPVYGESYADPASALLQSKSVLAEKHNAQSLDDIYLGNSGMSCFYAAFRALQEIQAKRGRHIWIQLGWLYLDTIELLQKYARRPQDYVYFSDVFGLDLLRAFLARHGPKVAGIVTESPTNPLVETPDIAALQNLARENEIALVLDPTIVSPHNIHCLEYADVVVNSLTKYAASEGDVMMGSLALNHRSFFYSELKDKIPLYLIQPYQRDLERLSFEIQDYDIVISRMNENLLALVEMLERHPKVSRVHHALSEKSRRNYEKIRKEKGGSGCMLSLEVDGDMAKFYDSIRIAKGPSFGMKYSLLCPFLYLAHFDLVQSQEGRKKLWASGLNPELIRVSVGCEETERLCAVFSGALDLL